MNFIFCLYEYFPYGGLQRDFLKITTTAMERGHTVRILTMDWQGEVPKGLDLQLMPHSAVSNHRRCMKFTRTIKGLLPQISCDAVVGFNKMPGLDVYYAADSCYQARMRSTRSFAYRLMGRYRAYADFERSVFSPESKTEILLLSPQEKQKFIDCYGTQESRFHLLPPGISKDRFRPVDASDIRAEVRKGLALAKDHLLLLMVGSHFHTKGVDRAIRAVASLPENLRNRVRMFIIGHGKLDSFTAFAKKMNLAGQVDFLGGRDDVPGFLLAADLLLHPARTENTGTALIEAMAAGLPVVVTENCGYAFHVKEAGAGRVVPMPFQQEDLNRTLNELLSSSELPILSEKGVQYAGRSDMSGLHNRAVDIIEDVARRRSLR
jgi:UDP-glucose:(heptosyl)LPS alpha-1,3-glucosyltransferase